MSPFEPEFAAYYHKVLNESKPGLSAKALLAAQQRFPGIGNGVLQDILFEARIHPRRKLQTLTAEDQMCIRDRDRDRGDRAGGDGQKPCPQYGGSWI